MEATINSQFRVATTRWGDHRTNMARTWPGAHESENDLTQDAKELVTQTSFRLNPVVRTYGPTATRSRRRSTSCREW